MVDVVTPRRRKEIETSQRIFWTAVTFCFFVIVYFVTFPGPEEQHVVKKLRRKTHSVIKKIKQKVTKWPKLENVYDGRKIIGDPQYLLDFAIIGFEKSGSSTFMKWLGAHKEIQCFQEEIYDLYENKPGTLVWRLDTQLEPGFKYKRGYKSPIDVFNANAIHLLDDYFPKTRLLISLRHPVLYYESLYNFRIQNLPQPDDRFRLPLETLGECEDDSQGVCTNHANYGQYMYRLGKTLSKFPTETEQAIIDEKPNSAAKAKVTLNPIFVVELSQLKDHDPIRKDRLKRDLKDFLGLQQDLEDNPVAVPGKTWPEDVQAKKDARKMDICDEKYDPIREELMRVSNQTATWILESFIKSDDVYFSSPKYFEQSMLKWYEDPCDARNLQAATA